MRRALSWFALSFGVLLFVASCVASEGGRGGDDAGDVIGLDLPDDLDLGGDPGGPGEPAPEALEPDDGAEALEAAEPGEVADVPLDHGADQETTTPAIVWGPCPGYIDYGPGFECAFVPAPLDPAAPDGPSIEVFVYRLRATESAGKRQLWFLQGGPGGSGADFAQLFAVYAMVHPEWELYSLDHRGVGNSARLTCAAEQAADSFDAAACAVELTETWGAEGLRQFTATNAARDLGLVIDLAHEPGVPVFVYGGSYGTYWGLRYLQLFPEQPDGVILDSICAPGACHLDEYDRNFNDTGKLILQACAADATCAAKLGVIAPDPWAAVGEVFARIDDGSLCDGAFPFLDRPLLRLVLGFLETDSSVRVLIPGLIYRLHRCDANDQAVLWTFFEAMQQMSGGGGASTPLPEGATLDASLTLGLHVILAELLGSMSYADVQAIADAAYFSTDGSPGMLQVAESGVWPVVPDDGYMNRWAETATPLLMLNGTLDPQTTLAMAEPAGAHYTGAHQTFVAIDAAPHGVLVSSQTYESVQAMFEGSIEYLTRPCGFRIMESFVADPTAAPDTTCLGELYPLEFGTASPLNRYVSAYLFGTEDMYEGPPMRGPSSPRPRLFWNPLAKPPRLPARGAW